MAGRMARSWDLTKQSWRVLMQDKHLAVFPLISGVLTCLIAAGAIVPAVLFLAAGEQNHNEEAVQEFLKGPVFWLSVFVVYFLSFTVITYFNAALVACVIARFEGRDSSAMAGLRVATSRLPKILAWALLSSTVGVVLSMLKERAGFIARLLLRGAEVMWTVATFFVVPVLVVDNVGPVDAVKKSIDVLKKTWGESLVAQFGASIVLGLAAVGALVLCVGGGMALVVATGSPVPAMILAPTGLLLALLIGLLAATLKAIMVVACYRFASAGQAPAEFDADSLRGMFKIK